MRLLVTGSRRWTEVQVIADYIRDANPDAVIHGMATGADEIAADVAFLLDVPVIEGYPAWWEWEGRSAGPRRNRRMLEQSHPDQVVAFPTKGSIGTWDMVHIADRAGVPIQTVSIARFSP